MMRRREAIKNKLRIATHRFFQRAKKDLQLLGHYGKRSLKPSGRSLKGKIEFPDNIRFVVLTSENIRKIGLFENHR
jgi:hypothetical protein